jgi:hypothetical protein
MLPDIFEKFHVLITKFDFALAIIYYSSKIVYCTHLYLHFALRLTRFFFTFWTAGKVTTPKFESEDVHFIH